MSSTLKSICSLIGVCGIGITVYGGYSSPLIGVPLSIGAKIISNYITRGG